MEELIYPSGNQAENQRRIASRLDRLPDDLEERWQWLNPAWKVDKATGEELLLIEGLEVMGGFQKPYMEALAKIVSANGGNVLNIGFGLGLLDNYIQKYAASMGVTGHHIIEYNEAIFQKAVSWRAEQTQPESIHLHLGKWEDIVPTLGHTFDGVAYDAYPLKKELLCRDFVPFMEACVQHRLLKEAKGVLTCFLDAPDGLGSRFGQWCKSLGFHEISLEKVPVRLPPRESQTWDIPWFLAPRFSGLAY